LRPTETQDTCLIRVDTDADLIGWGEVDSCSFGRKVSHRRPDVAQDLPRPPTPVSGAIRSRRRFARADEPAFK